MSIPRPIDTGSIDRRLRAVESAVKAQDGARRLAAATISEGGLTIVDGGGINVHGGGDVFIDGGRLLFRRLGLETPGELYAVQGGESGRTVLRMIPPSTADDPTALYLEGATTGQPGIAHIRSGGQIQLHADGNASVRSFGGTVSITADDNVIATADNQLQFNSGASTFFTADNNMQFNADSAVVVNAGTNATITAEDNFTIQTDGAEHRIRSSGNDVIVDAPTRFYVAADLTATGNLSIQGDKNFVIEHPTRQGRALIHSSTESPMAGIEYTGTAELNDDGEAVVNLPEYFEALAADESRTVHLTPVGRPFMIGADPIEDGKFTAYGDPGRSVSWLVKARRAGMEYDAEPLIEDSPIAAPSEA